MDWRYSQPESDHSDEESTHEAPTTSRKRSSRACDQCRKTKSKCERTGGETPCKSCVLAGTPCTFLGPSYKRGPPKGYIHAIEQRWHQVESLLGAVLQCPNPQIQGFVSALQQDDLAREILKRVDNGPYGPSGRRSQPDKATKEDFFASILKSNESNGSVRDSARSRRQSRVSREIVSANQDNGLSVIPTKEWQDNLSHHLAASAKLISDYDSDQPRSSRRRKTGDDDSPSYSGWNQMQTVEPENDEVRDALNGIGQLSLDENSEVRFHGDASGLHLLSRNVRTDARNEGGIWRLPMARVWPASPFRQSFHEQSSTVASPLPPVQIQDRLIDLYFIYVHPMFPVLNKCHFLTEYKYSNPRLRPLSPEYNSGSPHPDPSQEVTPLLLFSIFAITARFCEDEAPLPPKGEMWEAGCNYLDSAQAILTQVFHEARPSTVQSLLLLGYREFGIGSMEQAWLFIGMAIRMATDLGLNRDASNWKVNGRDLFSPIEVQTRRHIWWACSIADRYGSVYMGRPTIIKEEDYDTPPLDRDLEEDQQLWPPISRNNLDSQYSPMPSYISSGFRAVASISSITGSIITHIYPVRQTPSTTRRAFYVDMEKRLDQWYFNLPEELRYETSSRRPTPPPHILFLNIRYWGAVLLLHRAFIPNWKSGSEPTSRNTLELKAFDFAQTAASHVSSIVNVYRETFSLKRSSPFLTSQILGAAIMHLVTLTLRPSNLQASVGLQQCMVALKDMEIVWPSAARAWDLVNGVKMGDSLSSTPPESRFSDRQKRPADAAFGEEKASDFLQREAFKDSGIRTGAQSANGVQTMGNRIMAHMLGLNVPGIEPSTSYLPGYEWWPRTGGNQTSPSRSHTMVSVPTDSIGSSVPRVASMSGVPDWDQQPTQTQASANYSYDLLGYDYTP